MKEVNCNMMKALCGDTVLVVAMDTVTDHPTSSAVVSSSSDHEVDTTQLAHADSTVGQPGRGQLTQRGRHVWLVFLLQGGVRGHARMEMLVSAL